jgi:hypothetical protein
MKKLILRAAILLLIVNLTGCHTFVKQGTFENRSALLHEYTNEVDKARKKAEAKLTSNILDMQGKQNIITEKLEAQTYYNHGMAARVTRLEKGQAILNSRVSGLEIWKARGAQMTKGGKRVNATLRIGKGSERVNFLKEVWSYPKGNTPAKLSGYQVEKLDGTMQDITVADATKVLKEAEATGSFRTAREYLDTWRRTL